MKSLETVALLASLASLISEGSVTRPLREPCSGAQVDNGSDLILLDGTYTSFKTAFATDPNTDTAPTIAAINTMKIGFKVSG
jgi:hypothetical protein